MLNTYTFCTVRAITLAVRQLHNDNYDSIPAKYFLILPSVETVDAGGMPEKCSACSLHLAGMRAEAPCLGASAEHLTFWRRAAEKTWVVRHAGTFVIDAIIPAAALRSIWNA